MTWKHRDGDTWDSGALKRRVQGEWQSVGAPRSTSPDFDGDGTGFDEEAGFADKQWFYDACADGDIEVVKVTNLDDSGTGSYEWAVNYSSDPTLVVFEVAGVIDYGSSSSWSRPRTDNTYVAGQTAPSPGITIIRSGLSAEADNAVHEHYKVRPGNDVGSPSAVEAIDLQDPQENVIINHMSLTWATDNVTSHKEEVEVTWANNIIAEGLYESDHGESPGHNYGMNTDPDDEIAGFGNYMMSMRRRNPRIHIGCDFLWVNNYSYNSARALGSRSRDPEELSTVVAIGNDYEFGDKYEGDPYVHRVAIIYPPEDEFADFNDATPFPDEISHEDSVFLDESPFMVDFEPLPPEEVKDFVLPMVGARPADRDPIDERMVSWAYEGGGHPWIGVDSPEYEYPDYDEVYRPLDVPSDTSEIPQWLQNYTAEVELGTDNQLH